ncbi:MAG: type IV-A pilus assembly ATPase PilB [Deltaproteobacteria bacterium]|nr:type IV-A pilus assembly ATPase PilB [Deltaproteobacteria bacterium]
MKQTATKERPGPTGRPAPNKPAGDRDSSLSGTLKRAEKGKGGSQKLGQILLKEGLITQTQLNEALRIQEKVSARLGRILVKLGYVENKTIAESLARQLNLPVINIKDYEIPEKVIKQVPYDLAKKHIAIPIEFKDTTLVVAMADPSDSYGIEDIQFKTNLSIKASLATEESIIDAYKKYYKIDEKEYRSFTAGALELEEEELKVEEIEDYGKLLSDAVDEFGIGVEEEMQEEELYSAADTPIVKLVQSILTKAIKMGASDVHIEPFEKVYYVRYRLDGELYRAMSLPPTIKEAVTSRIKILSNLDIAERRIPQDGRIKLKLGKSRSIDIRVNTLPTVFGEGVVMRLLDKSNLQVDMTKLGFTPEGLKKFESSIIKPYGMALVTGPTGSGKTTTLYSALNKLNTTSKKILTAEDPVEYNFTGINQVQVKEEVGLTFASSLRAFLRQDPDIIMVGEIRDLETAEIAIKAALTGHFVLSTVHTNDCPSTIGRMLDIGVKPFLISSAITVVVAQRLLRRICDKCKMPLENPDPQALKEVGIDPSQLDGVELYWGKGCDSCSGTGFKGRVAVYEILVIDDEIRVAINSPKFSEVMLRDVAKEKGMLNLRQEGLRKVLEGITTLEEVLKKTIVLG